VRYWPTGIEKDSSRAASFISRRKQRIMSSMPKKPPPTSVSSVKIRALPMALTGALKAIARLNRNTTWVAMGLLGPVIFAAVMVAVRDSHPKTDDLTDVPAQIKSDVWSSANPVAVSNVTGSIEKNTDEIIQGQAKSVDFGITPQTNQDHRAVQAIASSRASAPQPGFARVVRPKIPHLTHRS
jgi:hypothetical protein